MMATAIMDASNSITSPRPATLDIFIENEPLNSATAGGYLNFFNDSTAADSEITLRANTQGQVQFYNNATAANAQIITETGAGNPGNIFFYDNSTAANANISLGEKSVMTFYGQSTAANATIALANLRKSAFRAALPARPKLQPPEARLTPLAARPLSIS